MDKVKIYLRAIIIPVAVGIFIGILTSGFNDYQTLEKPFLAPPGFLFPIIWSILYVLMGVSYGKLKVEGIVDEDTRKIYYTQLLVNALWPIIFFIFKWRFIAFLWIILLVILVYKMVTKFTNKNKLAGTLQIPYLIWTIFATYLNLFTYILNR